MAPRTDEQFELMRTTTEERITAAAIELFAENGYKNTSVASIAKQAGVSKGLMYNYFDSKEDLIVSILKSFKKMEEKYMKEYPLEEMSITQILEIYFNTIENNSAFAKMMISISLDLVEVKIIQDYAKEKTVRGISQLTGVFEKHGFDSPEEEAVYFITTIEGAIVLSIISGEAYPLEMIKKTMFNRYKIENDENK